MMERQQRDARAEADTAGALGRGGGDMQGSRHNRERAEEMEFRQPRRVEAEFVSKDYLVNRFLITRRFGLLGSAW
jgi:hypothetical protein